MSDVLIGSWFIFALIVFAHRRLRGESVVARAPGTWLGIAMQAMGFSVLWMLRASTFHGLPIPRFPSNSVLWGVETMLGIGAIGFATAAIWVLGRHWSVAAQLVEGHKLVTSGPYRYVRHPIYTSMFAMLLATGLSLGNPITLALAVATFVAGTYVRVYYEERLLRARFGDEFERYAASVPAFLPFSRHT